VVLIGFVVGHLVGNLQVYEAPDRINGYAHFLQSLGPALWLIRLFLLACVSLHVWSATVLTLESRRARGPEPYQVKKWISATFSSRYMRGTGYVVLAFILYHLAHFTVGIAQPSTFKENIPHYTMRGDYHIMGVTVVRRGHRGARRPLDGDPRLREPDRLGLLHRGGGAPLASPPSRGGQPLPDARLAQPPLGAGSQGPRDPPVRRLFPRQPRDSPGGVLLGMLR
jgi:hypothetical protein